MDFLNFVIVFSAAIVLYLQSPSLQVTHCDDAYKFVCDDTGCDLPDMDKIGCRKLDTALKDIENNEILFAGYKNCLIQIEFVASSTPPIKTNLRTKATDITAMTYSSTDRKLFIVDKTTKSIIAMDIQTKEEEIIKTYPDDHYPEFDIGSIVYDYINKKLIYSDLYYRTVDELSVLTVTNKLLVQFYKDWPSSLAIIPEQGILFVAFRTHYDDKTWRIDKMKLDGTERTHLLTESTQGPINLHYNRDMNQIFWTDGTEDKIHSMEVNGEYKKHIKTTVKYPKGLTSSLSNLFWINSGSMTLMWKDKTGSGETYKLGIAVEHVEDIARNFSLVAFGRTPPSEPVNMKEWNECKDDEFMCKSGRCIPKSWECDYEVDCHDRSDEHANCERFQCQNNYNDKFQCNNGRCIEPHQQCDHVDDCGDLSDEIPCDRSPCLPTEHQCKTTKKCISTMALCNGIKDCQQGDDEKMDYCNCERSQVTCAKGKCLPRAYKCDKWDDCQDGFVDDESNEECHTKTLPLFTTRWPKCGYGVKCGESESCIEHHQVCDGKVDCPKGEDEGSLCATACINTTCQHECHRTPKGPECKCFKGFEQVMTVYCGDIDECANKQACSHRCVNTQGSYYCTCYPGFEIREDMKTCKSIGRPAEFFFTVDSEIRLLSLANHTHEVLLKELSDAISGIDMDIAKRSIYYTLKEKGEIHRLTLSGKTPLKEKIMGRPAPGLLAVDWTSNNVYVVEGETNPYISLCSFETMYCRHFKDLLANHKVRAIVVDPINEYIFVAMSQWNDNPRTQIHRITLDGVLTQPMAMMNNTFITGLALDIHARDVYFSELTEGKIRKMDYNGMQDGNKTEIVHQYIPFPHNLQIFEDNIYLLTKHGVVVKCNMHGGKWESFRLMTPKSQFFVISQVSRQQPLKDRNRANMCNADEMKSKNCPICVKSGRGPTCFCEFSSAVSMNEYSCKGKSYEICGTTFSLPLYKLVMLWLLPLILIPLAFWMFCKCMKGVWKCCFHFQDGSSVNEEDSYREASPRESYSEESPRERSYRERSYGRRSYRADLSREGPYPERSYRERSSMERPTRERSSMERPTRERSSMDRYARDDSDSDAEDSAIPTEGGRFTPAGTYQTTPARPTQQSVGADVHRTLESPELPVVPEVPEVPEVPGVP